MVICGVDPILEFNPQVRPGGAGGAPPWYLLWLGTFLPMPEAFLNRIQNFLADILLHILITRAFWWVTSIAGICNCIHSLSLLWSS